MAYNTSEYKYTLSFVFLLDNFSYRKIPYMNTKKKPLTRKITFSSKWLIQTSLRIKLILIVQLQRLQRTNSLY